MSSVLFGQFLAGEMYFFSAHYQFLIVSESMGGSILCSERARQCSAQLTVPTGSEKARAALVELCSEENISEGLFFCSEVYCCSSEIRFPYQHDNIVFREKNPTALNSIEDFFWSFFVLK